MNTNNPKWHVSYQRSIEYDLLKTSNLFDPQNPALLSAGRTDDARRFIVIDSNVEEIHSDSLRNYFSRHQIETKIIALPGGEENKSVQNYLSILRELDAFPIHRRDEPIIAIGGGVLTDTVGYVASSYRRGVPHIKVPTTLMGYIDASVGVKNGINFNGHKNRLGSFQAPLMVLLDKTFMKTLPMRHILNGVCEIIKLAIIRDPDLFSMLEVHGKQCIDASFQDEKGDLILDRAISGMVEELQPNMMEENLERTVDFGHTFSYGLETYQETLLLHGEAVLLDMAVSVLVARNRKILPEAEADRIFNLIDRLGVMPDIKYLDPKVVWQTLEERVYHRNGYQRIPMPDSIGSCVFVNDVRQNEIQSALNMLVDWMVAKFRTI